MIPSFIRGELNSTDEKFPDSSGEYGGINQVLAILVMY
jgi:hypothetical protein